MFVQMQNWRNLNARFLFSTISTHVIYSWMLLIKYVAREKNIPLTIRASTLIKRWVTNNHWFICLTGKRISLCGGVPGECMLWAAWWPSGPSWWVCNPLQPRSALPKSAAGHHHTAPQSYPKQLPLSSSLRALRVSFPHYWAYCEEDRKVLYISLDWIEYQT